MKKLLFACAMLCAVFLFGCKKDKAQNPQDSLFIGANKNSAAWVAKVTTEYTTNKDSLNIWGFVDQPEETLSIRFKFIGVGQTNIGAKNTYYNTTLGRDAITSDYILDTTKANTVNITSFNVATGLAQGDFTATFKKVYGGSSAPESIVFSSGKFWVAVPPVK